MSTDKPKWTPGPWHIERDDECHCAYITPDKRNWDITPHHIATVLDERIHNKWQRNNARLIAQAPAMYEALERAIQALRFVDSPEGGIYDFGEFIPQLERVLVAADGRER